MWSRVRGTGFICHGDPGPWNTVWRDGSVVAFIDFDHAHTGAPQDDIVYAPSSERRSGTMTHASSTWPTHRHRTVADGFTCSATRMAPRRQQTSLASLPSDNARMESWWPNSLDEGSNPRWTWVREGLLEKIRREAEWAELSGF